MPVGLEEAEEVGVVITGQINEGHEAMVPAPGLICTIAARAKDLVRIDHTLRQVLNVKGD